MQTDKPMNQYAKILDTLNQSGAKGITAFEISQRIGSSRHAIIGKMKEMRDSNSVRFDRSGANQAFVYYPLPPKPAKRREALRRKAYANGPERNAEILRRRHNPPAYSSY